MAYSESASYVRSGGYTAVAQWQATHAYTVGQIVRQLAAPTSNNERAFLCIVAGTSGGSEPVWVLTRGAKTTDSTVTWMECTGLPALNGDNANTNAWHASAGSIAIGWIIKNIANTHYFIATTAGIGGTGSEPSWNTTTGATTTDNTVTWTCIGATSSFTTRWAVPHARLTTPLTSFWLLNAGMNIYIGDDHSENNAGTAYTPIASCAILCVDHTVSLPPGSADLKTTALITATSTNFNFLANSGANTVYAYGIQISDGVAATIAVASGSARNILERCTFAITGTLSTSVFSFGDTSSQGSPLLLKDCTFSIATFSTGQVFRFYGNPIKIENSIFTAALGTAGLALLCSAGSSSGAIILEGCDFSGVPSSAFLLGVVATNPGGSWTFKDCVIPAGIVICSGAGGFPAGDTYTIDLNRVDSGGNAYRNERYRFEGKITTSTSVVRTSGASDGATPVSHQITTNANTNNIQRIFNTLPFATWNGVTGTNRNVTVYGIANDSRVPNNDEIWLDAEYLGASGSPLGSFARGGKSNVLAAGSALTVDSSSVWDSAATARVNSHAYVVGDVIKIASNPNRIFFCITAGTSAGSEPGGYATAVDGGSVTDSGATFRAGCRFSQTVTLSSPQPQQSGYAYVYPKAGRASQTYYIDPKIYLS